MRLLVRRERSCEVSKALKHLCGLIRACGSACTVVLRDAKDESGLDALQLELQESFVAAVRPGRVHRFGCSGR